MPHISPVFAVAALAFIASCFVIWLIAKAPEGHENETGFHHGPKDKPASAPARSVTAPVSAAARSVPARTARVV